uniref:Uncharacterized protein n=2 Tax=Tetraselmis sp. GSL018 TaxID=582737 RepID=A0A061RM80_9CHLO|mmetsp:Transcript_37380/g.88850  ORF Transcript_37380/g.88850 Transcript_37380/m.88850 type:complete len:244 (-) Transcript_37380:302-1033(-)
MEEKQGEVASYRQKSLLQRSRRPVQDNQALKSTADRTPSRGNCSLRKLRFTSPCVSERFLTGKPLPSVSKTPDANSSMQALSCHRATCPQWKASKSLQVEIPKGSNKLPSTASPGADSCPSGRSSPVSSPRFSSNDISPASSAKSWRSTCVSPIRLAKENQLPTEIFLTSLKDSSCPDGRGSANVRLPRISHYGQSSPTSDAQPSNARRMTVAERGGGSRHGWRQAIISKHRSMPLLPSSEIR